MTPNPKKVQGLTITDCEDGFIVYQPERDRVHYLNPTATLVLELCTGANSLSQIAELLAKTYGLKQSPEEDVVQIVGRMSHEGLVEGVSLPPIADSAGLLEA